MQEKNFVTVTDANRNKQITVDIGTARKEKGGIYLDVLGVRGNEESDEPKTIRLSHLNGLDNHARKRIIKIANNVKKPTNGHKNNNKKQHRKMHITH